ncbi:MAG: Gfo/Idh/MocA family protein [Caulobacteraceae bacterium]
MALRIGLLGASRIAPKAVIAPAAGRDDVVITAVAARDLSRAQAYALTHGIAAAVQGYDALIARDDVDLVYCALPPARHIHPCLAALKAGKALLIEKPFAMTADQAQAIADAATAAGRPAMEAYHYRFHSMFLRALALLEQGRLGRLVRAHGLFDAIIAQTPGELRWVAGEGGGGTMDLGCYVLHALRTLTAEEPGLVSAQAVLQDGVDAEMTAELHFPSGISATTASSMTKARRDEILIEGEAGSLRLQSFVSPQRGGRLTLTTAAGETIEDAQGPGSYDAQLAHVVDVMRDETAAVTGGRDAVATMKIIDAMRRAAGMTID